MKEKLAERLYCWLEHLPRKPNGVLDDANVRQDLLALEPSADINKKQKEYVLDKLGLCALVVIVGLLFAVMMWIKETSGTDIVDNRLYRNANGEGSQTLSVVASNGEENAEFQIDLSERELTEQEYEKLYEELLPELEQSVLGQNESLDQISYDLELKSAVGDYPFTITWEVPQEYMDDEGQLLQETLDEPQAVELTAEITCDAFEREYTFGCCIYSRSEPFSMDEVLSKELTAIEESERTSDYITLPNDFHGKEVTWEMTKGKTGILVFFLTPILAGVIYLSKDRDLHKKVETRNEEMTADYAEIVSKLSLLLSAGMTVQGAWGRVVNDYRKEWARSGQKRYAYEEMLFTVHEMENGTSVRIALERFGRRCAIASYTRLSTLLAQNLTRGGTNLSMLLQAEARDAFEERKHLARKYGEQAGTKLLVPMMMLLGIVMMIIMVPALNTM